MVLTCKLGVGCFRLLVSLLSRCSWASTTGWVQWGQEGSGRRRIRRGKHSSREQPLPQFHG